MLKNELMAILSKPIFPVFESDEEAAAAKVVADAAAATKAATDEAAAKALANKTFSQEDLNKALATQKRETQTKNAEMITELEALQSKADLNNTERTDLETKIKRMKQDNMTSEELARTEHKTEVSDLTIKVESLQTELTSITDRYTSETINRSITDASVGHKALVPEQIIAILQPKTQIEDEVDSEGNKTGKQIPMVTLDTINDNGQTKTLNLTVDKAVETMKGISKYMNLFESEGRSGLGQYHQSNSSGNHGKIDIRKVSKDPVAYRKARKDGEI